MGRAADGVRAHSRAASPTVPSLLILWTRPAHLSAREAEAWIRDELGALIAGGTIAGAGLTRLESPSEQHPRQWDWMLELRLHADTDPAACAVEGPCGEWLADMRLLGMRPAVLAVGGRTVLGEDDR